MLVHLPPHQNGIEERVVPIKFGQALQIYNILLTEADRSLIFGHQRIFHICYILQKTIKPQNMNNLSKKC